MDNKKLAVIHIVKKELSLSDEEYRNILERVAGVRSSKDLTDSQFHKLMRYFVRTHALSCNKQRDNLTAKILYKTVNKGPRLG